MENKFSLDPTYSIIYHDENVIEFRNGGWNVTSHILNDHAQQCNLAKVILAIENSVSIDISEIAKKTNVRKKDCEDIVNILKEKNLICDTYSHQQNTLFDKIIPNIKIANNSCKNIHIITPDNDNYILQNLLKDRCQGISVNIINTSDLSIIFEHGEDLFRDALILEKMVAQCHELFGSHSLVIAFMTTHNPIFIQFINKIFYEANIPWFFTSLDGPFIYVGPLFKQTFCYECLETRILMNTKKNEDYLQFKKAILQNKVSLGSGKRDESLNFLASSLTSLEIGSFLATGRTTSTHKLLSIYLPTMEFAYHRVLRVPGCKVCGVDNALQGHQVHFDTGALLSS